jgi:hypothetical protein
MRSLTSGGVRVLVVTPRKPDAVVKLDSYPNVFILTMNPKDCAMTDQELRELVASLAVKSDRLDAQQAKTDAQIANTNAQIAKTDEKLNRLSELYGGVSSNQGSAAEEFFFNTLNENPVVGGIKFDRVTPNVMPARKSKHAEFDIVMVNGSSVAVVEVKYKVHPSDIDKVAKNLKRYREFYPEHKNYALYGGIAGFSVPADAVKAAKEQGLFVLKRVGQVVKTDAKEMRAFS